jgi:hypothetical protein
MDLVFGLEGSFIMGKRYLYRTLYIGAHTPLVRQHSFFRLLLKSNPVSFDQEEQGWDLFRYQDVKQVLLAPSLYSSERGRSLEENSNLVSL